MAEHVPVLLEETHRWLAPTLADGGWWMDCTVGLGGHAAALLERLPAARLVAVDRDPEALELAKARLRPFGGRVEWIQSRFGEVETRIAERGIGPIRGILADLGVSSMQLDRAERGFSFLREGPLDMRMEGASEGEGDGPEAGRLTAKDIVNDYPEAELAKIFKEFGEERYARRLARSIVEARVETPFETTSDLAQLVEEKRPRGPRPRSGRRPLHPATQVFQALRIEVNRELHELRQLLDQAVRLLDQDGRLVVISYHSLEDRLVKHTLRDLATGEKEPVTGRPRAETQVIEVLTKKPVRPSDQELAANPRARSARLRAARRL
ncbi:MAG: 16S rRNA (cytosine(1402)-N(4))-methyltransferase RsmH [Acidobacteriota bacterium]